jgi:hypothetical protein
VRQDALLVEEVALDAVRVRFMWNGVHGCGGARSATSR